MSKLTRRWLSVPVSAVVAICAVDAENSSLQFHFQQDIEKCGLEGETIVHVKRERRVFYLDNIKVLRLTLTTPYIEHARAERISAALPCISKAARALRVTFIPPTIMED